MRTTSKKGTKQKRGGEAVPLWDDELHEMDVRTISEE